MAVRLSKRFRSLFLVSAAAALAACSSNSGTTPVVMQSHDRLFSRPVVTVPPACKSQVDFPDHAVNSEKLLSTGGRLCIPAFGGFGGTISYPAANPSAGIKLTGSTTNYNNKLPNLASGTPIFYLQLSTKAATTFGTTTPAGGGLTAASIVPGKIYTIYGQAVISGFTFGLNPCHKVAVKGPYGGVVGGEGTLLKGLNVPGPASAVIEVFPGNSASAVC